MVSRELQHRLLDLTFDLIECGATAHFSPGNCIIVGFRRSKMLNDGDDFDKAFTIFNDGDCPKVINYLAERLKELKEKDPGDGNLQRSHT